MKKNLLKIALILVLVLTACIVFAACDPDNPDEKDPDEKENVELVLWGPAQQQKMAEEMIEAFKKEYTDKNYTITYNIVSEADAAGTITTDVSQGADVYAFANDQLLVLHRAGARLHR